MEPSGRNQWQPVANATGPENGENKPKPLPWVATRSVVAHGKEGVDGSSPSEGSAKTPHVGTFPIGSVCKVRTVRWIWSP